MSSNSIESDPADDDVSIKGIKAHDLLLKGVPNDYGLIISLRQGTLQFSFVKDANYHEIHPNIYAPASLEGMRKLRGGGSGVTVFQGELADGSSIVMKHGSNRDTKELFALATIAQELQQRGASEAVDMQNRIPEFRAIYISPMHLCERHRELWDKLKRVLDEFKHVDSEDHISFNSFVKNRRKSTAKRRGRDLYLCKKEEDDSDLVCVHPHELEFLLDAHQAVQKNKSYSLQYGKDGEGYALLKPMVEQLMQLQRDQFWKFTLAQKTIGGPSPRTASSLLADGLLEGDLLQYLINEFVLVVNNLRSLTLEEEKGCLEQVRQEVQYLKENPQLDASSLSKLADSFVGNAIRKNFHPTKGRLTRLRDVGMDIRSGKLVFEPQEKVPARFLGLLLENHCPLSKVFTTGSDRAMFLGNEEEFLYLGWRRLLQQAIDLGGTVQQRIWTCGATDAGLHNLFLSDKLWLFDLGEPSLIPLPGFLTKFLFSFFHTLGMQEDDNGGWVQRFIVEGDKLSLTEETAALLPKAYHAFGVVMEQFLKRLFLGNEQVKPLLIKYMVLQLFSDAAFCLEKWSLKGGGQRNVGHSNHQVNNQKWLWRAVWDLYVAFDLNVTYGNVLPLTKPDEKA